MSATDELRGCVTCAHGEFERTPTGRIKARVAGRCRAEPLFNVPACIKVSWSRNGIWPGDGIDCPTWKAGAS